jgi:FkbM family methyltransferase
MSHPWRRYVVQLLRAGGIELRRLGPAAILVARREAARRQWFAVEKGLTAYAATEHVAALLRLYGVNCVLDVGANRGQYGRRLRRAGYTGRIVSFEPVPEAFADLQHAAGADPAWFAHPHALGREDGTIAINVVPGTMSSVLAPSRFGARRYAQLRDPVEREVEVRRLDGVLDAALAGIDAPRIYLKLDTQGYDLEVFAGLGSRAGELVAMQAEVALMPIYEGMPRMPEAVGVYEQAGFEITALYPVSRQTRTARVLELDCVMVRAGSL